MTTDLMMSVGLLKTGGKRPVRFRVPAQGKLPFVQAAGQGPRTLAGGGKRLVRFQAVGVESCRLRSSASNYGTCSIDGSSARKRQAKQSFRPGLQRYGSTSTMRVGGLVDLLNDVTITSKIEQ